MADLIEGARNGDRGAIDRLFALAYDELRALARRRRRGSGDTLETTALVHEAYLKLTPSAGLALADRAHFTYIVARAMRQILVHTARRKSTLKRSPGLLITLDESAHGALPAPRFLALENALAELERVDPRRAGVVECRFFGGMGVEETARALGVSTATVKRDWRTARAWLARALD